MTLADRTAPNLIVPRLHGQDAAGVLQELSQVLQRAGHVADLLRFYHTALNRELTISSEVESGAAFPHGRIAGIEEVTFALGRSEAPIAWGTHALRSVRLVFLIAVPEGDTGQYLNLLGALTQLTRTPSLMARLAGSGEIAPIMGVLHEVPIRTPWDDSLALSARRDSALGSSGEPGSR